MFLKRAVHGVVTGVRYAGTTSGRRAIPILETVPIKTRLEARKFGDDEEKRAKTASSDPYKLRDVSEPAEEATLTVPMEALADLEAHFVFDEPDAAAKRLSLEDDPLLKLGIPLDVLRYETRRTLTAGPGGAPPSDSKAVLRVRLPDLDLDPVVVKWCREILGPRYDWAGQEAKIVSRHRPSSLENMRECAERLAQTIQTARELAEKHGDFEQRGPRTHLHSSRQHKLKKRNSKPRHKRNLPY